MSRCRGSVFARPLFPRAHHEREGDTLAPSLGYASSAIVIICIDLYWNTCCHVYEQENATLSPGFLNETIT